jgi:hypothetical protein
MTKSILILPAIIFTLAGSFQTLSAKTPASRLQGLMKVWVYEKSGDVVSDVSGIFDEKSKKITLKCGLKNLSKKEVHAVRGTLRFSTYFGDLIADLSVETVAAIPPGETLAVQWTVGPERMSKTAFETLQKTKLDQLKINWIPSVIAFSDGSMLK